MFGACQRTLPYINPSLYTPIHKALMVRKALIKHCNESIRGREA